MSETFERLATISSALRVQVEILPSEIIGVGKGELTCLI